MTDMPVKQPNQKFQVRFYITNKLGVPLYFLRFHLRFGTRL